MTNRADSSRRLGRRLRSLRNRPRRGSVDRLASPPTRGLEELEPRQLLSATMQVLGGAGSPLPTVAIVSGDITPRTTDHTDMGPVTLDGGQTAWTFAIKNTGADPLQIPGIQISGADQSDFTISVGPSAQVAAGATTQFAVLFDPSALGTRTATVTIPSNDPAGPYTFTIQGEGTPATLTGATEDQPVTLDYNTLFGLMSESSPDANAPTYVITRVDSGSLTSGGTAVTPGTTTIGPGGSLTWQPDANANHTQNAFTIRALDPVTQQPTGDPLAVRVEVAPVVDGIGGTLGDLDIGAGTKSTVIDLNQALTDPDVTGTVVQFDTNLGTFNVQLFDSVAPDAVQNFLSYLKSYSNTIINQVQPGFIVQGGEYLPQLPPTAIKTHGTVANDPVYANVAGTLAVAKAPNDPQSGTSGWFFNLADNSNNLDNQDGGFTVFGEVLGSGMDVVNAIGNTPVFAGGGFTNLPLQNFDGQTLSTDNFIVVNRITIIPAVTYTVSSSDPSIAAPTLQNGKLTLAYGKSDGTATVTVTATDAAGSTNTQSFDVRVADPVSAKAIDSSAGIVAGKPDNTATIRITRTGPLDQPLVVNYTWTGSAQPGVDFTDPGNGTVTIPAGQKFVDLVLDPIDTGGVRPVTQATLTVTPTDTYSVGGDPATFTVDGILPTLTISADPAHASEDGATGTLTITRNTTVGDTPVKLTIKGHAKNGRDYQAIPKSVVIPDGQDHVDIIVTPINDQLVEGPEDVSIQIKPSKKQYIVDRAAANRTASVIIDDNEPTISVSTSMPTVDENGAAVFTLTRTGDTSQALDVRIGVKGGRKNRDFVNPGKVVTIPAGAATLDIPVQMLNDEKVSNDRTLTLTVTRGKTYSVDPAANSASVTETDAAPLTDGVDLLALTGTSRPAVYDLTSARVKSLAISSTILNQGDTDAGPFSVSYVLSADPTLSVDDLTIATVDVAGLAAGRTLKFNSKLDPTTLNVPATGRYYLFVVADPANQVVELNENNNTYADLQAGIQFVLPA